MIPFPWRNAAHPNTMVTNEIERVIHVRTSELRHRNRNLENHLQSVHEELEKVRKDSAEWENLARKQHDKNKKNRDYIQDCRENVQQLRSNCSDMRNQLKQQQELTRQAESNLAAAQAKIFALQPYRRELPCDEVSRDYENLVDSVQDLVSHLMEPWLDLEGPKREETRSNTLKNRSSNVKKLVEAIQQHEDLVTAASWPDMDEHILTSLVMRYLHDSLFKTILYGQAEPYAGFVQFSMQQMHDSTEPKRDPLTIRNWEAEAFNAVFSWPDFKRASGGALEMLTTDLVGMLGVFDKHIDHRQLYKSLREKCVQPAAELYEKVQVSSTIFRLCLEIYPPRSTHTQDAKDALSTFCSDLQNLDCRNAMRSMKKFAPDYTKPEVLKGLREGMVQNVCSVVPALMMAPVGSESNAEMIVCKQRNVIACGHQEDIAEHREQGEATWVSILLRS